MQRHPRTHPRTRRAREHAYVISRPAISQGPSSPAAQFACASCGRGVSFSLGSERPSHSFSTKGRMCT